MNQEQPEPGATTKTIGFLPRLHRHMSGRYHWAIILGLLFGVGGATYGYVSTRPTYRSNAMLRITPLTLRILYAQTDVAPSIFDSFVDVQVNIMRSRPVIESILNSEAWRSALNGKPSPEPEVFLRNLEINHPIRSEIINISYSDSNPEIAVAGVHMLIDSYLKIQGDRSGNSRIAAVEKRSESLTKGLAELNAQITQITHKYGTDDLKQLHQTKVLELSRLETMIKDTEINLILAEAALGNGDEVKNMPAEEIAATDELMRRLIDEKHRCEVELINQRRGPEHPEVVILNEKLAKINANIDARATAFRKFRRSSFVNNVGVLEGVPTPAAVEALKQRHKKLCELYDASLQKSLEIGRQSLLAVNLLEQVRVTKDRLTENQTKLDQLRVDSSVVGQINVINQGELPKEPIKDKRRTMAAGGFAGGFGLGCVLIGFWSLADRRLRRAHDLTCVAVDAPLLGVLPELPAPTAQTAYCVRQIATALQADPTLHDARVFAVTSPKDGAGKTIFTSALGLAFATLGKRTLLIDADTSGHGFTVDNPSLRGADVLNASDWPIETRHTTHPMFDVLSLGSVHAGGISAEKIRALLSVAASRYDRVLIETASLDASLETILVCKEAESVLVVVRRNSQDPDLLGCQRKLLAAGASVGGIVFNGATVKELPKPTVAPIVEPALPTEWLPFGAITAAVAAMSIQPNSTSTIVA